MLHPNINSHLVFLPQLPRRTHHRESTLQTHIITQWHWQSQSCWHAGTGRWMDKYRRHATTAGWHQDGHRGKGPVLSYIVSVSVGDLKRGGGAVSVTCVLTCCVHIWSQWGSVESVCTWLRYSCHSVYEWMSQLLIEKELGVMHSEEGVKRTLVLKCWMGYEPTVVVIDCLSHALGFSSFLSFITWKHYIVKQINTGTVEQGSSTILVT